MNPCQRCGELADRCECPTFVGTEHMECHRCGSLQGQHLIDFAHRDSDRLVCP